MSYVIKTTNGKYVSDIYFSNGLDFETLNEEDAKTFPSKEDAENCIKECEWNQDFVYVTEKEDLT